MLIVSKFGSGPVRPCHNFRIWLVAARFEPNFETNAGHTLELPIGPIANFSQPMYEAAYEIRAGIVCCPVNQ